MFYIIGLGNPGEQYKESRHNTGRQAIERLKVASSATRRGGGIEKLKIIESQEFMNNSGKAVGKIIKSKKMAERLIVVYDDIDLGLGTIKISFDKGSGGHRGLESIIKALKTREFVRLRIGISPTTPKGKVKKPEGEKKVLDFILGNFSTSQKEILKKVFKTVNEAVATIVEEGREKAMNLYN